MQYNKGFTLIELMIAVAVVAILAAIGYASYTRYIVRNAEAQVEAKMQSLSMELDRYRSSRLTYRGFKPRKVSADGTQSFGYDIGYSVYSSNNNNKYVITIYDGFGETPLDKIDKRNPRSEANPSSWIMFAEPADTAMKELKYKYFMSSTGQRCRSMNADFDPTKTCTGAGIEIW